MFNREEAKKDLKKILSKQRYTHSLGVEKKAIELAKIYGCDEKKAAIAGLLHDYAKEYPKPMLVEMARHYGIEIDEVSLNSPGLLHGPVSAFLIKEKYGIDDEDIFNAITYHTVGRKNMTTLEKIIYLADMIEENRDFRGIDILREKALKNLDKTLLLCLDQTIKYTIERRLMVHPYSIDAYNDLVRLKGE